MFRLKKTYSILRLKILEIIHFIIHKKTFYMKLICIILSLITIGSCSNHTSSSKVEKETVAVIAKDQNTHLDGAYLKIQKEKLDFGKVKEEETSVLPFNVEIENTGKSPLVILKTDVSCGCIAVEYPQEPILPNKKGTLHIKVDIRGKKGYFNKTIFLKTNAINDVELIRITGHIK